MIIPNDLKNITQALSNGEQFYPTLKRLQISPIELFSYLDKYPDQRIAFELARQISTEQLLDGGIQGIDKATDPFELNKAIAKFKASQWLAEKLIPKTYGSRVDINVNTTIDIKGALSEARSRVVQIESVVSNANESDQKVLSVDEILSD